MSDGSPRAAAPASVCQLLGFAWLLVGLVVGLLQGGAALALGIIEPERLTVGAADQYRGDLAPGGRALYYMSNQNSTTELWKLDLDTGATGLLFDNDADVADPRVSPDGKHVLFITYRNDALGDVCLRNLGTGALRCLTDSSSAEAYAFWFPDGRSVGHLSRTGINTDFELLRHDLASGNRERLLSANLSNPTISPDGRWMAYVPLSRSSNSVGVNFSAQASASLELRPLRGGDPVSLRFPLPGKSGFPAFSADGRYLYFSQYLNDTNFDGEIDGDDNSVIFRVPIDPSAPGRGDAPAEQLTSALWNCQYPAPAADRLVVTCSHDGSLDVYALPLAGSLPADWTSAKLDEELEVARNSWNKLLILGRMLLGSAPAGRLQIHRQMAVLHTELREYESAEFYCSLAQQAAPAGSSERAWAAAMHELVAFRRAEVYLNRGLLTDRFIAEQRQRLQRLQRLQTMAGPSVAPAAAGAAPSTAAAASASSPQGAPAAPPPAQPGVSLAHTAMAEILAVLGEPGAAEDALARVDPKAEQDPLVLRIYAQRSAELLRLVGQRERLAETLHALSEHPALRPLERYRYAQGLVDELRRGRSRAERRSLVAQWRTRAQDSPEAALLLEVEAALLGIGAGPIDGVRKGIFGAYRRTKEPEGRKALVAATLRRALLTDEEFLLYQFANTWVSYVDRAHGERRYAERIYRDTVLERAYGELRRGKVADARGYFYGCTLQTDSLEAHAGFIEGRIAEGKRDVLDRDYKRRYPERPPHPVLRFVRAYLMASDLVSQPDPAIFNRQLQAALTQIRGAASGLPANLHVNLLWAHLEHLRFLRRGTPEASSAAYGKYLLALDLARRRPRLRASVLHGLGLLSAAMGNHRIAASHFWERLRLPFREPLTHLALLLALARSQAHIEDYATAAATAATALELIEEHRDLAPYRPLAHDRRALALHLAGDSAGALAEYELLAPLVAATAADPTGPAGPNGRRNRLKLALGQGAASLAAGLHAPALRHLRAALAVLEEPGPLPSPDPNAPGATLRAKVRPRAPDYLRILHGLLAHAAAATGDTATADASLTTRLALLRQHHKRTEDVAVLLDIARAHHQRAALAHRAGRYDDALQHLQRGLKVADRHATETGSESNEAQLRLLLSAAELHLDRGVPLGKFGFPLEQRLRALHEVLCARPNPERAAERFQLGVYWALVRAGG